MNSLLLILATIFCIHISIFLFRISKIKRKKWVDIEAFCVYNNTVYWLKDGLLYSSDYSSKEIDILSGKVVDEFQDLMPVEAVSIVQNLKERQKK